MKKIIIRAGYHFELSAGYVKLSPVYDSLSNDEKLLLLNDVIAELEFEKAFICSQVGVGAPSCCPTIVDQPSPVDASS
jgi:hypothetical protein